MKQKAYCCCVGHGLVTLAGTLALLLIVVVVMHLWLLQVEVGAQEVPQALGVERLASPATSTS